MTNSPHSVGNKVTLITTIRTILGVKAALGKWQLSLMGQRHAHLSTFVAQPASQRSERELASTVNN